MREDVSSVLAELQSVDRKAYKLTVKKSELAGLERILGSDETLLWVQPLTLIADPNGEVHSAMVVHAGLAALSDSRMLFLSESATAQWAYEDMSAVADAKPLGGLHKMRIVHREGPLWFTIHFKKATGTLLGTLEALIRDAASRPRPTAHAVAPAASIADELEKLARIDRGSASDR